MPRPDQNSREACDSADPRPYILDPCTLLLLAAALAGLLPGDAVARAMFISVFATRRPAFTATPTPRTNPHRPGYRDADPIAARCRSRSAFTHAYCSLPERPSRLPSDRVATRERDRRTRPPRSPRLAPTATPPSRGRAGYLPPPTLTAPGAFANGQGLPQLTGPRTSQSQSGVAADPQAVRRAATESETARLIDNLVSLLSYGWLCCGSVLVVLVAVGFVWLARRKPAG